MERVVKVGRDFSRFPAGRYKSDGPYSGELFRERFLEPTIRAGDMAIVDLAGVEGYGSSFLEEAFGGLARISDLPTDRIESYISIMSNDPDLEAFVEDAKDYLNEAIANR